MTDLNEALEKPLGFSWKYLTLTFKNDERVLKKATKLLHHTIKSVGDMNEIHLSPMIQPLPASFAKHIIANGGNIIGLDRFSEKNIFFFIHPWLDEEENKEFMHKISEKYMEGLSSFAKSIVKSNPCIYLTYVDSTKDLSSYASANIQKMRAAAAKRDPEGVFQTNVPEGFKLSEVLIPEEHQHHDGP